MESVPSLSSNYHETIIKISDSSFIENKGMNFTLKIVGLWKDGKIESKIENMRAQRLVILINLQRC